ncbi:MAG: hypothetical protein ACI4I4_06935 [Acutalibacteraceae bacterium]
MNYAEKSGGAICTNDLISVSLKIFSEYIQNTYCFLKAMFC